MFSTLRTRFGIPGVISVMALVFAMFGGAYAASNSSGGGKATASAKAKQGKQGKPGKPGPAGPQGPTGPAGPAGAKGDAGANGSNGSSGGPGAAGKSVTVTQVDVGDFECEERGGAIVGVEGSPSGVEVCAGNNGEEGSPWTDGGTLPSGATETGLWNVSAASGTGAFQGVYEVASISFPIPLSAELNDAHAIVVTGTPPSECENSDHEGAASLTNPEAKPGYLCVFQSPNVENLGTGEIYKPTFFENGAVTSGAVIAYPVTQPPEATEPVPAFTNGTWAVTGQE
jgi:hypothetical protein